MKEFVIVVIPWRGRRRKKGERNTKGKRTWSIDNDGFLNPKKKTHHERARLQCQVHLLS